MTDRDLWFSLASKTLVRDCGNQCDEMKKTWHLELDSKAGPATLTVTVGKLGNSPTLNFLISEVGLNMSGPSGVLGGWTSHQKIHTYRNLLFKCGPIPYTGWLRGGGLYLYGPLSVLNNSLTLRSRVLTKVKHLLVFKKRNVCAASALNHKEKQQITFQRYSPKHKEKRKKQL